MGCITKYPREARAAAVRLKLSSAWPVGPPCGRRIAAFEPSRFRLNGIVSTALTGVPSKLRYVTICEPARFSGARLAIESRVNGWLLPVATSAIQRSEGVLAALCSTSNRLESSAKADVRDGASLL